MNDEIEMIHLIYFFVIALIIIISLYMVHKKDKEIEKIRKKLNQKNSSELEKIIKEIKSRKEEYKQKPHELIIDKIKQYKNVYHSIIFNKISDEVIESVKKYKSYYDEKDVYFNDDKSVNILIVEQMTVQLLMNYLDIKLTSGNFHIYRGVLNEEGKILLQIYKEIIKELIRLEVRDEDTKNLVDESWINRNINGLCKDIRNIG